MASKVSACSNIVRGGLLPTLSQQQSEGRLAPLPHVRLRAQLSFADKNNPSDIRRAALFLLERVREYYEVMEYCGPSGDNKHEYPCALAAEVTQYYAGAYRASMNVHRPMEGPATIWNKAGYICLDTAFAVAVWELNRHYPEVEDLLDWAGIAALNACKNQAFSAIYWRHTRRRINSAGVRQMLDTVMANLNSAVLIIAPYTGIPCFQTDSHFLHAREELERLAAKHQEQLKYASPSCKQAAQTA